MCTGAVGGATPRGTFSFQPSRSAAVARAPAAVDLNCPRAYHTMPGFRQTTDRRRLSTSLRGAPVDRSHPDDAGVARSVVTCQCPSSGSRRAQPVERHAGAVRRCARSVGRRAGSVAHLACSVGRRTCSGETLRTLGRTPSTLGRASHRRFGTPRTVGRTSRRLGRTPRTLWRGTAHARSDTVRAWPNSSRRNWPLDLL